MFGSLPIVDAPILTGGAQMSASSLYPCSEQLWHRYAEFSIFDWSVSGNETCIVVHGHGFRLALDIGACPPQAVFADNVFVSHGHVDHCGALHMHIRKRRLHRLRPATYYLPECLLEPMTRVTELFAEMQQDKEDAGDQEGSVAQQQQPPPALVGVKPGDEMEISGLDGRKLQIRVFATDHRVPSVGFILRRQRFELLPGFRGLTSAQLSELVAQGTDVRQPVWDALLAYTGDTRFSLYQNPPDPDLLKVRLLIAELTFLEGPADKAKQYGHSHLDEFSANWRLFDAVGRVVFFHFSNRYAPDDIAQMVYSSLHPKLGRRVYCGLTAKRMLYS